MSNSVELYHSLLRFGVEPGLERISALLDMLGNPQEKIKVVHIAGTNGKGSTAAMMSEILIAAGYKTGLFISPYITSFNERMQINAVPISTEELDDISEQVFQKIASLNEKGIYPTEFEAVTAAAFLYFYKKSCDVAVIEVGLGGRFDSTNVIKNPLVSIITSISIDHVGILGNTVEEIALEKCGIIKRGCPVVTTGAQEKEVLNIIKNKAIEENSPLVIADIKAELVEESILGTIYIYNEKQIFVPFAGRHQVENSILAINAAMELSKTLNITIDNIICGIKNAKNPARTEVLSRRPLVILDGSHNEASVKALAEILKRELKGKRLLLLVSMMEDKQVDKAMSFLYPLIDTAIVTKATNPRAMSCDELSKLFIEHNIPTIIEEDPQKSARLLYHLSAEFDACLVCGSLYLAGDVRQSLIELFSKCDTP